MDLQMEINNLFDNLKFFTRSENLAGHPIVIGNITIIPILSISFGAGNGSGSSNQTKSFGAGIGGKISPIALVIIKDENIRVISLKGQHNLQEITDLMPEALSLAQPVDEISMPS